MMNQNTKTILTAGLILLGSFLGGATLIAIFTGQETIFFGNLLKVAKIGLVVGSLAGLYLLAEKPIRRGFWYWYNFILPEWKMSWHQARRRRVARKAIRHRNRPDPRVGHGGGLRLVSEHVMVASPGVIDDGDGNIWTHT